MIWIRAAYSIYPLRVVAKCNLVEYFNTDMVILAEKGSFHVLIGDEKRAILIHYIGDVRESSIRVQLFRHPHFLYLGVYVGGGPSQLLQILTFFFFFY